MRILRDQLPGTAMTEAPLADILAQTLRDRREFLLGEVDSCERALIQLGQFRGQRTSVLRKSQKDGIIRSVRETQPDRSASE